jgi:hypothetical protein
MKKIRMLLVGLLAATGVVLPLFIAAATPHETHPPIMRIADQPTPTPTPNSGICHGGGC